MAAPIQIVIVAGLLAASLFYAAGDSYPDTMLPFIAISGIGALLFIYSLCRFLSHQEKNMNISIYHNPACGTSRNALALIRATGTEPEIIEYLTAPPSREVLIKLIRDAGLSVRQALRQKGTPYDELGLDDVNLTDDQLLDAMMAHPILINRPFVVTPIGTRLCRPSDLIMEILPQAK